MTADIDRTGEDEPDPNANLVDVFDIKDGAIVPLVKIALDGAGIEYTLSAANVLIPGVSGRGAEHTGFDKLVPGKVLVRAEDAARARDLLADLEPQVPPDAATNDPTTAEWAQPDVPRDRNAE